MQIAEMDFMFHNRFTCVCDGKIAIGTGAVARECGWGYKKTINHFESVVGVVGKKRCRIGDKRLNCVLVEPEDFADYCILFDTIEDIEERMHELSEPSVDEEIMEAFRAD